jgi:hypothetical protein
VLFRSDLRQTADDTSCNSVTPNARRRSGISCITTLTCLIVVYQALPGTRATRHADRPGVSHVVEGNALRPDLVACSTAQTVVNTATSPVPCYRARQTAGVSACGWTDRERLRSMRRGSRRGASIYRRVRPRNFLPYCPSIHALRSPARVPMELGRTFVLDTTSRDNPVRVAVMEEDTRMQDASEPPCVESRGKCPCPVRRASGRS